MDKHWEAHPGPQTESLQRNEFEILYGGARGGGKTDAGLAWMLYDIEKPEYRGLVIRRNADDLSDWLDRAREMYRPLNAEIVGKPAVIRFPSGAKIRTGHLKDENAYTKYQGHEYHRILIEELTQIPTEDAYMRLISSCRSTVKNLQPQVFATTNPGNIGHAWVKRRFVDAELPGVPHTDSKTGRTRIFIPAKIENNPTLMENDPDYVKWLEGLPEDLRKAWRDGSRDVFETKGAYYASQINEARKEGRICKNLFDKGLEVHTFWDLGISDTMVIFLVQFFGKEIRIIDCIYGEGEGFAYYFDMLNKKKSQMTFGDHYGPHDLRVRELGTGQSRREIAMNMGYEFKITPNIPVADGIQAVKSIFSRIRFDQENTEHAVTALMQYRSKYDERNNVYTGPVHDWTSHFADGIRYMAVNYPTITQVSYDKPVYCEY